jgi:hypothetical protein
MVTLNPIFTNDMILQANKPVRVFGNGTGDVTVEFLGKTQSVVSNGEWHKFDAIMNAENVIYFRVFVQCIFHSAECCLLGCI